MDGWLPSEIRALLTHRKKAKKQAHRAMSPSYIFLANALSAQLETTLKEFNENKWWEKVSSLNRDDGSLWKMAKALKGRKSRKEGIRPMQGPEGVTYLEGETAEILATTIKPSTSRH